MVRTHEPVSLFVRRLAGSSFDASRVEGARTSLAIQAAGFLAEEAPLRRLDLYQAFLARDSPGRGLSALLTLVD